MSRTFWFKAQYAATMGVAGLCALAAMSHFGPSIGTFGSIFAVLLLPGRVLGYFWRDLLRGLRLLNAGDFAGSRRHSELFLEQVRRRPYLRHFVWLGSSAYSRSPTVLALNNLGAAEVRLGEVDLAIRHLEEATQIDGKCPLPFFNMGIVRASQGDIDEAERCFQQAARLGYSNSSSDKIMKAAQGRFAWTDGRGHSSSD